MASRLQGDERIGMNELAENTVGPLIEWVACLARNAHRKTL